jgi:membrane protein YqaA with SNARE-associated domain
VISRWAAFLGFRAASAGGGLLGPGKLPHWLAKFTTTYGGLGLFTIGFLDSSVLSLPFVNDLLLVRFSIVAPHRMPYYAAMATLGSLAGCIWLYYLAKKGGEVMYRRYTGQRAARVRDWVLRNKFLSVAVPAILPPPLPFKPFVLAAGVFQVPVRTFAVALLVGRGLRYFLEGFLAVRYGPAAQRYFVENKLELTLIIVGTVLLTYAVTRWIFGASSKEA